MGFLDCRCRLNKENGILIGVWWGNFKKSRHMQDSVYRLIILK
jgi:hypothetical protein